MVLRIVREAMQRAASLNRARRASARTRGTWRWRYGVGGGAIATRRQGGSTVTLTIERIYTTPKGQWEASLWKRPANRSTFGTPVRIGIYDKKADARSAAVTYAAAVAAPGCSRTLP